MRKIALVFISFTFVLLCGCAGYWGALSKARSQFLAGCYEQAGQTLEDSLVDAGKNDLLYLLEAGSSFHYASQYKKSISFLERADELARIRSCISVSAEAAAIAFDDRLKAYRCPDYERFMTLYLLAINRFSSGEIESALVELNRIFEFENDVAGKGKEWLLQPVAHYLAGLCYLRFMEFDNAKREFSIASEMRPENKAYQEAVERATQIFKTQPTTMKNGWLLAFIETGLAPVRKPRGGFSTIPIFCSVDSPAFNTIPSILSGERQFEGVGIIDFESNAYTWLEKMHAIFLAREVGRVVAREVMADQIGKAFESEDAENIARIALLFAQGPDLRSWRNLPQRISVFAIPYPKGKHSISISGINIDNSTAPPINFTIKNGKITTIVVKRR